MKSFINKMRKVATIVACLAVTTAFASCEPADEPAPGAPAFAEFSFASQRGTADIDAKKRTVKAVAECGTNLAALAPAFKLSPEGTTATVDGKPQENGKTANNFADAVVYKLAAPDGTTAEWTVTVTLPDDCPQVKKYITYNKPVTAYYIEYDGGMINANKETDKLVAEAYENKKYADIRWDLYATNNWGIRYIDTEEIEYTAAYGSASWYKHTGDPTQKGQWASEGYKYCEYPLESFAAYVSQRKQGGGFLGFGHGHLSEIAASPDVYVMPNNTDVTSLFVKSEKVCNIQCDVFQDSEQTPKGTETITFWVDLSTGLTLKYEVKLNGTVDKDDSYEVTKLVIGSPDWNGKHLHPLASDTFINVD